MRERLKRLEARTSDAPAERPDDIEEFLEMVRYFAPRAAEDDLAGLTNERRWQRSLWVRSEARRLGMPLDAAEAQMRLYDAVLAKHGPEQPFRNRP